MKKAGFFAMMFSLTMSPAFSQSARTVVPVSEDYKPVVGVYSVYGGTLGDIQEPKPGDAKIAFSIEGRAAKAMFEQLGRDVRDECLYGTGTRSRRRGGVDCRKERNGPYICNFGFDLNTGKSIGGIIC